MITSVLRNGILRFAMVSIVAIATLFITESHAQTPAQGLKLSATLAGQSSPAEVKIDIVRWSTEQERNAIMASLSPPAPARGAAAERPDVTDPFGAFGGGQDAAAGAAAGARGARGGARGARGARGGRGGDAAPRPFDPVVSFATAISGAPTIGYIWTSENSGYSIKYAFRTTMPDGNERVILATNRPLASLNASSLNGGPEFMVLELRLNAKTGGEGKAIVNAGIATDPDAKTIAVENYATATAVLRNVKR